MSISKKKMKLVVLTLVSFFILGLNLILFDIALGSVSIAEASRAQSLGELEIGDRVVDNSWMWEFRTGYDYSYQEGDLKRPVNWIVVAKNHYDVVGDISHVTLLSECLIGYYVFDNSTHIHKNGSNHWGGSGNHETSTQGLRRWLNSTDNQIDKSFYNALSNAFSNYIVTTKVPNKETKYGDYYITQDKVFIPSSTEIGNINPNHVNTYEIGSVFTYFDGASNADRVAKFPNDKLGSYWTRSPGKTYDYYLVHVSAGGSFLSSGLGTTARHAYSAVRPIVNLSSDVPVSSTPNSDGVYVIQSEAAKDSTAKIIKWEINGNYDGFKLKNMLNYFIDTAGYVIDSTIQVYATGESLPSFIVAELSTNETVILSKIAKGHYSQRFYRHMFCSHKFIDRVLKTISIFIQGGFYLNTEPPVPPQITVEKFIIDSESFITSETGQSLPELLPLYKSIDVSWPKE